MIKFQKIVHDVESLLPDLVAKFAECREIEVLYLYGSRTGVRISPLSDVDLAVVVSSQVNRERLFDLQLRMLGEATKALRTNEVDLQILNKLPIQAQYAIMKKKRILFCRDHARRAEFESGVISRYLDFKPFLEEQYRAVRQRIRNYAIERKLSDGRTRALNG